MYLKLLFCFLLFTNYVPLAFADLSSLVDKMRLEELRETFDAPKVTRLLAGHGAKLNFEDRSSAAVLISIGIINPEDLTSQAKLESKIAIFNYGSQGKSRHLMGPFNSSVTLARLENLGGHEALLGEKKFISTLHSRLNDGVVTGYDLRGVDIAAGFDPQRTLTYSHSSIHHIKQLTVLLASEGVEGLLYVLPKVSAFLFREGWGEPPTNVTALDNGQLVVNGREWVVFFEFSRPEDKLKFHEIVTRYAKKDDEKEEGLIAESWWQPFYYSGTPIQEFERINLIILKSETTEATLTVLPEKLDVVMAEFDASNWHRTVEDIWVNKPFYRFLNGGFK
jgi:hypothetical protein